MTLKSGHDGVGKSIAENQDTKGNKRASCYGREKVSNVRDISKITTTIRKEFSCFHRSPTLIYRSSKYKFSFPVRSDCEFV